MIGPRIGPRVGPKVGPAAGVSADELGTSDPLAGLVTRDATSGIYCPASAAEWTIVLAAAGIASGGPSALWLLQEAAGNPADSIGAFTLTAAGGPSYQQAVAGWSRQGIAWADNSVATLTNADAGLPNVASASQLLFGYVKFPTAAPAAQRNFGAVGTVVAAARVSNTPRSQIVTGGGAAVSGASDPTNAVRPLLLQLNRTGTLAVTTTDQEEVSTSNLGTVTGKQVLWGASSVNSAAQTLMYLASFHNAAAELTTAQKRTLLRLLGWSVAF